MAETRPSVRYVAFDPELEWPEGWPAKIGVMIARTEESATDFAPWSIEETPEEAATRIFGADRFEGAPEPLVNVDRWMMLAEIRDDAGLIERAQDFSINFEYHRSEGTALALPGQDQEPLRAVEAPAVTLAETPAQAGPEPLVMQAPLPSADPRPDPRPVLPERISPREVRFLEGEARYAIDGGLVISSEAFRGFAAIDEEMVTVVPGIPGFYVRIPGDGNLKETMVVTEDAAGALRGFRSPSRVDIAIWPGWAHVRMAQAAPRQPEVVRRGQRPVLILGMVILGAALAGLMALQIMNYTPTPDTVSEIRSQVFR